VRVTIDRDGERRSAEVAPDLASVTVDGRTLPCRVVAQGRGRVELEVGGERIVVDGWPDRDPDAPPALDVDGERWSLTVSVGPAEGSGAPPSHAAPPQPTPPSPVGPAAVSTQGVPVLPPMPGKVVELRVRDGESVVAGQVLLVLEAMKMRNEIASPLAGIVRGVAVAPGGNVRAREPMLFVEPG